MKEENVRMPSNRTEVIKELIKKQKTLSIKRLSDHFNVSYLTIRRDLDKLEEEGILKKVHGGAVRIEKESLSEPVFEQQRDLFKDEKDRIALEASKRIKDNNVVIIESGSTCLEIVKYLDNKKDLKVVTAGIPVGIELYKLALRKKDIEVGFCGGFIRPSVSIFYGSHALNFFKDINANVAFIGTQAISLEKGISTATYFDSDITKAIIEIAKNVILLADSTKFETFSFINVAPLEQIDEIITDKNLDPVIVKSIRSRGIKITLV